MRNEKISTVTVLGSTGSIGRQTMEVVRGLGLTVWGISGGKNVALLEQQIRAFSPAVCAVADEAAARDLRVRVQDLSTRVEAGAQAIEALAAKPHADLVYNSILGTAGLRPTLAAVERERPQDKFVKAWNDALTGAKEGAADFGASFSRQMNEAMRELGETWNSMTRKDAPAPEQKPGTGQGEVAL